MKIKLQKVNKYYYDQGKSTKALENISLEFKTNGSFVVITGESGAGKSSLIKVLTGIEDYDEGEIFFDDVAISSLSSKERQEIYTNNISFVFQDYNLVESISCIENINLALLKQGKTIKEAKKLAKKALFDVDLEKQINMRVSKLSGGERQRVAIARSLALNTPIIVFDEPTGNLDNETSKTIIDLIYKISKNKLILYVTHDYEIVQKYVTRHIVLSDGNLIKDENISKVEDFEYSEKKNENIIKFSIASYLYSTYLIGFKRVGRMLSTLLVLLFAYAGILGSFYGFANGIILTNSTLSILSTSTDDTLSYNMGNEIYNRKNTIAEVDLSFDADNFTDYANDLDLDFSLISPAYNDYYFEQNDLPDEYADYITYNRDYRSSASVVILPYYDEDEDLNLISGTDEEDNFFNLLIPDYISEDSYYFDNVSEIYQNEFSISIFSDYSAFDELDLESELNMRTSIRATGMYSYDSQTNSTDNLYLICNNSYLNELKEYIQNVYSSISISSISNQLTDANSDIVITIEDETITGSSSLSSTAGTSYTPDKLYLSKNLENKDIEITYKNLIISQSDFDVEYVDLESDSYAFQIYQPGIDKMVKKLKIESTSYFPTAEIAQAQYEKYKSEHPRLFCQTKTSSNYVDYDLAIWDSYSFARIGYLSLFILILIGILLVSFLIKSIINRFYYRKSYDQQVLQYIGYSFKDIIVVNLIEFIGLSLVSSILVYTLFLSLVPSAFLIFSANIWMLILAIVINLFCAIFFALPKRKKVK